MATGRCGICCKNGGANDGVDVATLDEDRIDRLRKVFWDMTEITTRVETIDHGRFGRTDSAYHYHSENG